MNTLDPCFGNSDPIAVIGLACRFPKAPNAEQFWHNLVNGISGQSFFSEQELQAAGITTSLSAQENFVPSGAIIDNPDYFDASLFGYSPTEALSIDPQQRLFLQIVWHALEDAGYAPNAIQSKTGVFGSIRTSTYPSFADFDVTQVGQVKGLQALLGNDKDYLATRVAHKFNLTGPAFTVQTACSSSLVACHLACESLRSGECDMAIAGGVAVSFPQSSGYLYQPGMIFSPDGLCRPFDIDASGTFGGHGLGCVVLKRWEDARRDGDTILALLRGSAINNDGQDKVGFTAPSVKGQAQVLSDALHLADVLPDEVEMIEAHGTGTKLGDPIEVRAIKQAYQRSIEAKPCFLGSVKSGFGHLDTAAGIASLIKTVLSVSRRKIPASLNVSQANPALELTGSGFQLATTTIDWPSETRTAAVSSFGIGGTNCHMIVQSAPELADPTPLNPRSENAKLLISANSETSLRKLAGEYATRLEQPTHHSDIAYSAMLKRALDLPYRLAIDCNSAAIQALRDFALTGQAGRDLHVGQPSATGKVVWCFTGQGSQWANMGQELYHRSAAFRDSIELSQQYALGSLEIRLTDALFGHRTELLQRTDYAQLAIVAFEIAMAAHWQSKGFRPDMVMGHSVGEFAACVVSGYLTHQQAIALVSERGRLMHLCAQRQAGSMLAIFAKPNTLETIPALRELDLAAHNGAQHWVYSGHQRDVDNAILELDKHAIRYKKLDVSCAAHSRLLDEMLASFHEFAAPITAKQGTIPLISSVTGQVADNAASFNAEYWTRHVRDTVQFQRAIESALAKQAKLLVEMGPSTHLTAMGQRETWSTDCVWLGTSHPSIPTQRLETELLAALFVAGCNNKWSALFALQGRPCRLPLYVFDEQRYWYPTSDVKTIETALPKQTLSVPPPTTIAALYPMLRCCVIRDLIHSCTAQPRFTLRDLIRGGRLLPKHRDLITTLLNSLLEHGYLQQGHQCYQFTAVSLPTTDVVAQWLRDALATNQEPATVPLSDIRALCETPARLKQVLRCYHTSPLQLKKQVAEIKQRLLSPLTPSIQPNLAIPFSNQTQLLCVDWVMTPTETDWHQLITLHMPSFVQEERSDWLIVAAPSLDPKTITQLVVHRTTQLWGQVQYQLRGCLTSGEWAWIGQIQTPNFDDSQPHALLPSPHQRYEWQWLPVAASQAKLNVSESDLQQALQRQGEIYRVNETVSLLVLPDGELVECAEKVIQSLSADFTTLYVLTSQAMATDATQSVAAEKVALMSLLRVARAEHKQQGIYILDIEPSFENHHHQALILSQALNSAPFHLATEIAYRNHSYWIPQLVHAKTVPDLIPSSWFTTSGWHLVTGGMGGIGRHIIKWLAQSGARHIAVIGRREPSDWPEFCQTIARFGCQVMTLLCDVSQEGELQRMLNDWPRTLPIIGAFHAAGTSLTGLINQWDPQQSALLIQTKCHAFVALHQWLEAQEAQYLLGLSSAASLGAVGQGAYALANAFLDGYALAQQGSSRCRVMSIGWGAWDSIGMTADSALLDTLAKEGMHTLNVQEGLWQISQSLLSGAPFVLAMNIEPQHANFQPYLDPLNTAIDTVDTIDCLVSPKPLTHPTVSDVGQWLTERLRYQLGMSDDTPIRVDQDLLQLGLDSLQFLELSAVIQKQFAVKIDAEQAYQNLTISGLVEAIARVPAAPESDSMLTHFVSDPHNRYTPFPLTPIQHAYWIGREPWVQYGGIACHVVFEWDKDLTEFNPQQFAAAWNALIKRHDMLRMTVNHAGEQVVHAEVDYFPIVERDLRSLSEEAQHVELEQIRQQMRHQVRAADVWPLFDVQLSRLSEHKVRLHLNLDLLQFDVQSFKIMMDDLATAYQGKDLEPLPITFRDYVMHEQTLRHSAEWQNSWHYWQQTIPTLPKAPQLPLNPDYQHHAPEFITLEGRLSDSEWQTLKSVWQQWGVTPSAGLLTLFAHTLANWTASPDFTLNMTFFNRQPFHEAVQDLIGDFTSVLLMDFQHDSSTDLKQRILQTQSKLWQRLGHGQVNGVEVIRELAKHWKSSGQLSEQEAALPLTPVVFTSMLGMSMDGMDIEQAMTHLLGDPVYVLSQTPQVWLDHQIMEIEGDLAFNWYCMAGVLAPDLLENLFNQYLSLLQQCAADPQFFERSLTQPEPQPPLLPPDHVIAESTLDWHNISLPEISPQIVQEVTQAWAQLEHRALCGIWATLRNHQLFTSPEQTHRAPQIIQQLKVTDKHHKLIQLWLDQLCREGVLTEKDGEYRFQDDFPKAPGLPLPQQAWCQRLDTYLEDCLKQHPALLNGRHSALELLFSDPAITDSLYRCNPSLQILNLSAARAIYALGQQQAQGLNILEVGAGTAATTREVLSLASSTIRHYQFTDVSRLFLHEARELLSEYPQVSYGLFDINQPIDEALKMDGGYQVILAVNVLHDAIDLAKCLQGLRALLADDGYLILIEATDQHSPMQLATVGFIEGINAFNDFRQSSGSGMLTQPAWLALLAEQGLEPQLSYPNSEVSALRQHLIVTQKRPQHRPQTLGQSESYQQQIEQIKSIWQTFLHGEINHDTDFFLAGGDSLMATKMIVALQHAGIKQASLQSLFEHPKFQDFCCQFESAPSTATTTVETDSIEPNTILGSQDNTPQQKNGVCVRHYPLTPLQNAYWLGENALFSLGNGVAHFYAELEIKHLDRLRLTQAWNRLVQLHDQLRGEINAGQYHIHRQVPEYQPQFLDLSSWDEPQKTHWIDEARTQIAAHGVATDQWPLFDISILQVDAETSLVHLILDLVVADGKSLNTLFQQWFALYDDLSIELAVPTMSIDNYLLELEQLKHSEPYQQAQAYWLNRIPTLPEAPALPLADKRSEHLAQSVLTYHLSAEQWSQIQAVSFAHNLLPSMSMLSTFCLVISHWSAQKHFAINILHSNRPAMLPQSVDVIGNLSTTSMLEVRTQPSSLLAFVEQIQQQMADDMAHSLFDGQSVLTEKNRHNHNLNAGMPVVFNDTLSVGQHRPLPYCKLNAFGAQTPHVYLDSMLIPSSCGGVIIKWTIQENYLKSGVFEAMFAAYTHTLETLTSRDWQLPLALELPSAQQQKRDQVNATQGELKLVLDNQTTACVATLCDLVRFGVEQHPQRIAIEQGELELTYQTLWFSAQHLAAQLIEQQDDAPLVAVVMNKGWQQVVAVLAILLAGKAYMPIDGAYPEPRIQALLKQGAVSTIISDSSEPCRTDDYRVLIPALMTEAQAHFIPVANQPTDLAYVIFTSGSTGQPKGVMMEHGAVVNTLLDINQRIALDHRDRVLAISSLNFDLSVFDIFSTLSCGARLVIPQTSPSQDPEALLHLAQQSAITVWNSVPAFAQLLVDLLENRSNPLPHLRQIMMSGDWIPVNLPDRLNTLMPQAKLLSLGGATEAAIWSICYPIEKSYATHTSIPYGKPLTHQQFYVLDEQLNPCADWVTGELYIGGRGLARGYWHDQEKTDFAFIEHPTLGQRLYKTGDLGRYLPDGNIEFLGRNDHQVKINGYRIELGEVENALRQCALNASGIDILDAIVQPDRTAQNGARLVAYIQYAPHSRRDNQALLDHARRLLPQYLCPSQIITLEHLPLTANGKVDRSALPRPDAHLAAEQLRMPHSQQEQLLAQIWSECLNFAPIPANQSFFDLGGNSLIAVRLLNQINHRLNLALTAGQLQTHDTVERLATLLTEQTQLLHHAPVKLSSNGSNRNRTLFIVHPIGGHLLSYQALAKELNQITLYGLAYPDRHDKSAPKTDIVALAAHYLSMIRHVQPTGPYQLAGWSFGGVVAFEMARQLMEQSEEVSHCILIDSYKPSQNPNQRLTEASIRQYFYADCIGRFPALKEHVISNFESETQFCAELAKAFLETGAGLLDSASFADLLAIYQQNLRAMLDYQPPYLETLPVTLYSAQNHSQLDFMRYQHPEMAKRRCHGWSDCCHPIIHRMQGDHYTLLQQPHVKTLAHEISTLLGHPSHSINSFHQQNVKELENEES
ncbi:amino acid adenylation domain-containing protein [Vibrio cholerae]